MRTIKILREYVQGNGGRGGYAHKPLNYKTNCRYLKIFFFLI